jgi:hypothetical protein
MLMMMMLILVRTYCGDADDSGDDDYDDDDDVDRGSVLLPLIGRFTMLGDLSMQLVSIQFTMNTDDKSMDCTKQSIAA